jgi:hypothetical protein
LKHNNLKGLEEFFNKIKIPGVRKYINELNEMYNKTING